MSPFMMGRHGFSKLPTCPTGSEMHPTIQRRRPFSRFELCLLVPLTVFAVALAVFTTVYLVQHHGTVKPAAIAALCCTTLLLLAVGYIVSQRLQRPEWHRDIETGPIQKWQISAPVPASLLEPKQTTLDSKGFYAVLPESRPSSPGRSTLSSKVRLVVKKTFSPSLLSQNSLESSASQANRGDRDSLIRQTDEGDGRCSTDSSDDEGLWISVFELAGDARLEQLRRANLKRLSRESRHSRYEMSGWEGSAEKPQELKIVVTKPEPTASGGRRGDQEFSLTFDPLRANPVRLSRDPSVRQTKSSQDLPSLSRDKITTPALRRPRSAEPGHDRSQLGLDRPNAQNGPENQSATPTGRASNRLLPVAPSLPISQAGTASSRTPAGRSPRGLRKLPSPNEHDLREVFRSGDGVSK